MKSRPTTRYESFFKSGWTRIAGLVLLVATSLFLFIGDSGLASGPRGEMSTAVRSLGAQPSARVMAIAPFAAAQENPGIVVTNTSDRNGLCYTGDCSLREALNFAALPGNGYDTISFAPGLSGVINLTGALPSVARNLKING